MIGVTAAIQSFVMHDHRIFHMFIQILIPDSGITDHGMGFDDLEFRIGQLSGLPQQFIGQLQLADIIIETAEDQCIFLILRHGQPVGKSSG